MNTEITLQQLKELKLSGMARSYESVLQLPVHQHPEPHALIAQLTDAELQKLQETRLLYQRRTHASEPSAHHCSQRMECRIF